MRCAEMMLIGSSIVQRYFEVFCSAGATGCTDWGEIWLGGVKLKILLKFLHINALQGRIPWVIFTKFLPFVGSRETPMEDVCGRMVLGVFEKF